MPRSFLVKKPSSTRVPNYSQLDTRAHVGALVLPYRRSSAACVTAGGCLPPATASPPRPPLLLAHRTTATSSPASPSHCPPDAKAPPVPTGTRSQGTPLKDTQTLNLPPRRGPHQRSFSCRHCAQAYASLGTLKVHIRTHTLPCLCRLCGKAFSRPWLLQGHIRTHTGEKPYACPHCSRAFADRSNLRAHLQTHLDVKKYRCHACARTFSRMSLLARHEEGGCCGAS
ncbi:zinc finger protein SNAI3 [Falco naumanni]|uniref:zinc finger protein SNAI3 n=1 Tax=Falco naumanni TaxID=148594 RepID=UPI001ADE71A8|nr:zinc finger protein SNAI3 [Falco naumanni]